MANKIVRTVLNIRVEVYDPRNVFLGTEIRDRVESKYSLKYLLKHPDALTLLERRLGKRMVRVLKKAKRSMDAWHKA